MTTNNMTQKIIDGLHRAAIELEELQVQVALGKAEAHDLYEAQKKRFNDYLHSVKDGIHKSTSTIKTESTRITELLSGITDQLSKIKTETKEEFEVQKKNLLSLLLDLETYIRSNKALNLVYSDLLNEIEVFKLKLEMLKYRFDLKKLTIKEEFEKNKTNFLEKLNEMKNKVQNEPELKEKWEHFQTEISEAYFHMKKAFSM